MDKHEEQLGAWDLAWEDADSAGLLKQSQDLTSE